MALYLNEQDVTQLLTMPEALKAVEEVFVAQATGDATNQPRRRVRAGGGVLMTMSGAVESLGLFGLKAYTVAGGRARFHVSLYDAHTGELLAFIEADKLGQMRTGAASGVATKYLARPDAKSVGIYGTGWQADSQLAAICQQFAIEHIRVYSRSAEHRANFCERMSKQFNLSHIEAVEQPEAAADADIIITITSSREPVLLGQWLTHGTHINAAGGNSILRRELDDEVIRRAGLIAVDSLDQARIEAGELVIPVEKGLLNWERVHELRDIISGQTESWRSFDEISIFKSLGIAIEDIAVAAVVYRKAKEQKMGKEI